MTNRAEVVGEYPAVFSSCDECNSASGFAILREFLTGIISSTDYRLMEMRARVHEDATGHTVTIYDQKLEN